jgi:hypothetical protein
MGSAQEALLACTCAWILRGWAQGVGDLLTHSGGLTRMARRIHASWLTMLFTKHCPQCHIAMRKGAAGVVRRLGRLYCCQAHADMHAEQLDAALHDFQCRHAACHGDNRLLPREARANPAIAP